MFIKVHVWNYNFCSNLSFAFHYKYSVHYPTKTNILVSFNISKSVNHGDQLSLFVMGSRSTIWYEIEAHIKGGSHENFYLLFFFIKHLHVASVSYPNQLTTPSTNSQHSMPVVAHSL
jgi:hypothetical protein